MIVLQIFTGTLLIAGIELIEGAANTASDDQVVAAGKELQQIPLGLFVVLIIVQIVLHCIGIQGAIVYKQWMVYCSLASHVVNFVINIIGFNILGLVLNVSFAYPHIFFIYEINQNIMSKFWMLCKK
jgi:hypothetical protein